jgi:hypothetical protein
MIWMKNTFMIEIESGCVGNPNLLHWSHTYEG